MSDATTYVYVIYEYHEDGDFEMVEAHVSEESADAALKTMHVSGQLEVEPVELKSMVDYQVEKEKKAAKRKEATKKAKKSSDNDDLAKSIAEARKSLPVIPDARPNALKGLKMLFTGTMTKDRKTYQATATVYGAQVISNPTKADYVVLGTRPGAKKLQEIQNSGVETMTEEQFIEMLKTGPPQEKVNNLPSPAEESDQSTVEDSEEDEEPLHKKFKIES